MANGEVISLDEAKVMTAAHRANNTTGVLAHHYDKDLVLQVLNQTGCTGLRMYHGIENDTHVMVLVGTDSNGDDMENGVILERGTLCPPRCPKKNNLNS